MRVPRNGSLRAQVARRDGGRCVDCGPGVAPWEAWEADHIVALVDGGPDTLDNMVTRCLSHHRAKTIAEGSHKRGGRPNRDRVMVSFYISRAGKEAIAKLAEKRGETQADTHRAMLAYAAQHMPKGWHPKQ